LRYGNLYCGCPFIAKYYVGLISTFPCQTTHIYFGDTGAIEPSLANDPDIIWFAGYEKQPDLEDSWEIERGPSPAEHHSITETNVLFGNYATRVLYPAGLSSSRSGIHYKYRFIEYVPPIDEQENLYCRYYVRFDSDFTFVKGGKLPGFIGGEANTGGNKPHRL
jgi:hypothetical protein